MENKKEDLRVIKTRKAITEAFRKLALDSDLKNLTVKDITDEAMISRKTFYLHYRGIEDLFIDVQQQFMNEIFESLGSSMNTRNGEEAFRKTLLHLARTPQWSYLICSRYDYRHIWDTVDSNPQVFNDFIPNKYYLEYVIPYLINAIRSLFCQWYQSGMKLPAEKMASLATEIVFSGIRNFDNAIEDNDLLP